MSLVRDEILRKLGDLSNVVDPRVAPTLGKVLTALAESQGQPFSYPTYPSMQGTPPPPVELTPHLQKAWDAFEEFFTLLNVKFGWPNRDQYIFFADIAATLSNAVYGDIGLSRPPNTGGPWAWDADRGEWVQINLTPFPEAPPTGLGYLRNGLTNQWVTLDEVDGGNY